MSQTTSTLQDTQSDLPSRDAPASAPWLLPLRVLFRFAFAYLILYMFPSPLDALPYADKVFKPYNDLWDAVIPWVGRRVFHVAITVQPNGSGDTTYNYVQVFCIAVFAAASALIWSVLDRKRTEYMCLHEWMRVYVRFYLASALITYGSIKVIPTQFPAPGLSRLIEPFGNASPMGLLWTFMGASIGYNVFAGSAEMLGGLLLTTRRTALIGALVAAGVMSNVVMLNFCYDVPVKLFSLHLLLCAVFLTLPDIGRLADLFLLGRAASPVIIRPLFTKAWMNRAAVIVRTLLVLGFAGMSLYQAHQESAGDGPDAPKPPLYGIWNVETLATDGIVHPPLLSDAARWQRVVFDYPGTFAVFTMDDTRTRYTLVMPPATKTLILKKRDDPAWKSVLSYTQTTPGSLTLDGAFDGHSIHATLRHADTSRFLLMHRGFHWINEYPLNR